MKSLEQLQQINKKYREFITFLGEGLIISWWVLLLLEFYRSGIVSTVWDLNIILILALLCVACGLVLNNQSLLPYSFVSLLSAGMIIVIVWNMDANIFVKIAAPVMGLLTWLIFRNYD